MSRQIIFELDETTAEELDAIAPTSSRRRSAFIRKALRKALDEAAEARMEEAYRRVPAEAAVYFDAEVWESKPRRRGRRK